MAARTRLEVVGGALVRVLAVGEIGDLDELHQRAFGEALGLVEPVRDRDVIAGRVRERLGGELAARLEADVLLLAQLVEDEAVALGIDDDGDAREVLRRGTDHRGTAHVDRLDDVCLRRLAPCGDAAEGIEVDHEQIDRLDPVLLERGRVGRVLTPCEQGTVDVRVERLDAAPEHLGEARHVLDLRHGEPVLGEMGRRSGRRDQLDSELAQTGGELRQPVLVRHRDQRALDCHSSSTASSSRASFRTVAGKSRCSTAWMRARSASGISL